MAPSQKSTTLPNADDHQCDLPVFDPKTGEIVYYDIQSAEPGAFAVPAVRELEVYAPGEYIELSWVYMKGDMMAGPQPGHPFELPYDRENNEFSVDLVELDDTSSVVRHVMPPTTDGPFWDGGAPFGDNGNYTMYVPQLRDRSCKYYEFAMMIYRWTVPEDLAGDTIYRLRLTSSEPAITHISGKLSFSGTDGTSSPSLGSASWRSANLLCDKGALCYSAVGILLMLLCFLGIRRLVNRSRRIALG